MVTPMSVALQPEYRDQSEKCECNKQQKALATGHAAAEGIRVDPFSKVVAGSGYCNGARAHAELRCHTVCRDHRI